MSTAELLGKREYKYGFVTDIESDVIPRGLTEDTIRLISAKKNEPEWMLDFRLKAYRHWLTMTEPKHWPNISYPAIDLQKGGSIQGVIDGLNQILDLAVAEYRAQGGTWIIPSRGRLADTADVASYRNMLVMIRDRVQDLKKKGQTLAQVKAAHPTLDFDGRYGATTGPWTSDMFVEAVYRSLPEKKP